MNRELKLLLLEDDPMDAELLQTILRRAGLRFSAVLASDEAEFLQALKDGGYHAVLADNALPQYSSMEALKMIRATNPDVAFILVTGTVSEEFAVKIIQQGADDYILKTNLTRLPSAITNAIEKKKIQQQNRAAEQEIKREREFSDSIINSLPGIFFLCDANGKLLRCNQNLERISGMEEEMLREAHLERLFSLEDGSTIQSFIDKSLQQRTGETEAMLKAPDGTSVPFFLTSKAVVTGSIHDLICVGLDISARKQSEADLKKLNEELRSVSAHLERIREEEQARIAREVHDQLGQQLTGLKMDLSWLQKNSTSQADAAWASKMAEMNEMLDEAVRTVRKIASDLRPGILDDFGLVAGLEWHSREFSKRSGIAVHFLPPAEETRLDASITTGLFRIYQEALTNVARHAGARNIHSSLSYLDDSVVMIITDDGRGFDTSLSRKSLGLLGMKERAHIINGNLEIDSKPGHGTTVTVSVPLKK